MLDPGVAVHDHVHVVLEERAPLGDDEHLELARRGENLLSLVAPRLVVALDAERADRLHALQVRTCVVQLVDLHLRVAPRAVEDDPRREEPRRPHDSRARHLARREELRRVVGGIVRRRDSEREAGVRGPVLLRDDAVALAACQCGRQARQSVFRRRSRWRASGESKRSHPRADCTEGFLSTRRPVPINSSAAFNVTTRPRRRRAIPDARRSRRETDVPPAAGASGSFSGAPGTKANVSGSARVKSSGPRDQWRRRESPDQWTYSPASFETRATGSDFAFGPMSIRLPVRTNGVTKAL